MVTIINYGLGNIQAFANIYHLNNIPYTIANSIDDLRDVERLILPGVGSFDWAIEKLNNSGMRERIDELVLSEKKKVIGICVGMQMMGEGSDEGKLPGLGWIQGNVRHLSTKSDNKNIYLPHMGWNNVTPYINNPLFTGMNEWEFYFLHSYYFQTKDTINILATTNYHGDFAAAIYYENIYGVQFHPEKSHNWGKQLLINFATL